MSSLTRTLTTVRAIDIVVGDQVNLGHQWRRVAFVEHHLDVPSAKEIDELTRDVIRAARAAQWNRADEVRDYGGLRLAAHALYVATDRLQRWPEPYVVVKGGSATTLYEKRFNPDELVAIVTRTETL